MAETLKLKVVTPLGSLIDEEAKAFTACSELGEFTILPNHRPIMVALGVGRMIVESSAGAKSAYALDSGFLEAGEESVNVITEQCVPADKLDSAALAKKIAELEQALSPLDLASFEAQGLLRALKWANVCLEIADKPVV